MHYAILRTLSCVFLTHYFFSAVTKKSEVAIHQSTLHPPHYNASREMESVMVILKSLFMQVVVGDKMIEIPKVRYCVYTCMHVVSRQRLLCHV